MLSAQLTPLSKRALGDIKTVGPTTMTSAPLFFRLKISSSVPFGSVTPVMMILLAVLIASAAYPCRTEYSSS